MEADDLLDDDRDLTKSELLQGFRTLAVFAHLGNGFWGIVFAFLFMILATGSDFLSTAFNIDFENDLLAIFLYLAGVILCVVPVIGVIKMSKKNKSGFTQYAVPNVIWIAYCLWLQIPTTIFIGALSLGFIVGFSRYLKYMK